MTPRVAAAAVALLLGAAACEHENPPGQAAGDCSRPNHSFSTNASVGSPSRRTQFVEIGGLRPGASIRVTATGTVNFGQTLGIGPGERGPEGIPGEPAPDSLFWPAPGLPKFSVFGTWNHTATKFPVGADSRCIAVPPGHSGPGIPTGVWVGVNDDGFDDNQGDFRVWIRVWRR